MRILNPDQIITACAGEAQTTGDVLHCPLRSSCMYHHHYLKVMAGKLEAGRFVAYNPSHEPYCEFPTPINPQP